MATPIWKDYTVDLGTTDGQEFSIYDTADNTGNVIYKGKAYIKPGATHAYVKVNDLCADYLKQTIAASLSSTSATYTGDTDVPAAHAFSLYVSSTKKADWVFILNWEYLVTLYDPQNYSPHRPITGRIQVGMKAPLTCLKILNSVSVETTEDLSPASVSYGPAPFNFYYRPASTTKQLRLGAGQPPTWSYNVTYKVIPKCHRWALYYVNELGGVDVLVLEGKCSMKDSYDRKTYKQSYDNSATINRGEVNYHNDIRRTWELHTGWLTDAEAGRMGHLLGSTLVYLCDCDDDYALLPVNITNGDCPYKKYRSDGMIEYGINVELARDITRR